MHSPRSARLAVASAAALLAFVLSAAAAPAPAPSAAPAGAATASPNASISLPPGYEGASAACRAALAKAAALAEAGAWKSAFAALDEYDAKGVDPYALAMKTELCLEGFAQSMMHRLFGLKDLLPGEDLESLRRDGGEFELVSLDPAALAEAQAEAGVAPPPVLSMALGDYYYDVQLRYEGGWFLADEEVRVRAVAAYGKAEEGGLRVAAALRRKAELLVVAGDYEGADSGYRAAIALEPGDPELRYRFAVSLLMRELRAEALAELDAALAAYAAPESRFEAYVLAARAAAESGDAKRSASYLDAAEREFPDQPAPGFVRHLLAVEGGAEEAAAAAADALLARFPASPYVVRALVSSWLEAGKAEAAAAFLDRSIDRFGGNYEALGGLEFYKALLIAQVKGEAGAAEALAVLDRAEGDFRKALPPEHEVYGVIAEIRANLAPSPDAAGEGAPKAEAAPDATSAATGE